jgi:Bacterial Ig domain
LLTRSLLALTALFAVVSSSALAAADCHVRSFSFDITSEGPWPAFMTVKSGKSCGSRSWRFGSTAPSMLYIAAKPAHGSLTISHPATYHYTPAGGYVGNDSFTLRVCGTKNGGYKGCANIRFDVSVVS